MSATLSELARRNHENILRGVVAVQKAKRLGELHGKVANAQREKRVKRNTVHKIQLEDEWAIAMQEVSDRFFDHLDIEAAYLEAKAGWKPITAAARLTHFIMKVGKASVQELKLAEHTLQDVLDGKYKVGVESSTGGDLMRAQAHGLYTTTVRGIGIYAKDKESAAALVRYLEGGGEYGTRQFSRLLGYTKAEIDAYFKFLEDARAIPTAQGAMSVPEVAAVQNQLLASAYALDVAQGVQVYLEMALNTSGRAGQAALDHMGINKTFSWAHPRAMASDLFSVRGSKVINNLYGAHLEKLSEIIRDATDPRHPQTLHQVKSAIKKEWPKLSAYQVARLARTETATVWTATTANTYMANGITRVESLIAHGPSITIETGLPCDMCVDAAAAGPMSVMGDLPPWHPHCRCEIVPVMTEPDGTEWFPPDEPWAGGERAVCGLEGDLVLSRRRARGLRQMRAVLKASGVPGCLNPLGEPGVPFGGETYYNRSNPVDSGEVQQIQEQIDQWPDFQGEFPQHAVKDAAKAMVQRAFAQKLRMKLVVDGEGKLTGVGIMSDELHWPGHPPTITVLGIATRGSGARRMMGQFSRDAYKFNRSLAVNKTTVSPQLGKSLDNWGFKPVAEYNTDTVILARDDLKLPFKIADDEAPPLPPTHAVEPTPSPTPTEALPSHADVPPAVAADETLDSLNAQLYTLNNKIAGNRKKIKTLNDTTFPDNQKIADTQKLLDEQIAERVKIKAQIDYLKKQPTAKPIPDDPIPDVVAPAPAATVDPPPLPEVPKLVPFKAANYESTIVKVPGQAMDDTVREGLEQEMTDGGWPGDNILDAVSGSVFFDQEIAALGGELGAFVMRTTDGELRGLIPYIKNAETKTIELVWHTGMKFSEDVEGMLRASTTLAKLSSDMGYSLRIRPSSAPGDTMTLRSQLLARGGKDKGFDDSLYWTPAESRKGFGLEGEISPPYAPGVPIILPQAQQYQVKLAQEAMDELLTKTDGFKIALLPDEDSATARLLSTDDIAIHWDENPPTGLQDAIVHEYGHYIDKNLMAGPGNWGSSELLFNDFYTVAKQSPTMQGIIKGEFSLLHDPSNALGADATYLLQGREMWARAFNQYIARHSGNMDMLTNLQKLQQDPLLRFQVWQDSEFKLIEVEIEKLLKGAGLLKKEIPTGVPLHQVHYINPKNGKPVVTAPMNESDANDLLAKLQDENIKAEALPEGAPAPIIDDISIGDGPPVSPEYVQKIHELGITKYPDKGDKAWEILGDEKDTLAKFTNDNGDWTPERTQLHNDIIAAHFADKTPPPTGERSAFFTAGGGASGKSGMRFNYKGQDVDLDFLEVQGDTVYIDPDRIKKMIPEYKEMQDAGDAYAAGAVHEESSILSKMIAARARKEGYNVVFDTTGSSGRFLKNIQDYADMGYKTHVSMVSIPTNTAISRSITRALKKGGKSEGRFVAISALKQAHKDASLQLIKWQKMKDITEWRVYDNSGDSIKLVAEKKTGQKPAVYDDKTFKDIKNKANEGVIRPVKQKPETGFSTPEQGAGVQVGVTVEHLKATLYSVNNKIAGWNKKLKKNPDDIDAQKKKAELEVEKENLKEQIKGAGGKPVATKPAAAKTPKITQWKVSYEKPDGGKVEQMFDSEIEAKNFAVEVPISETVTKPKIEKVEISTRPRAPREKPDPKPDPKLVHQPDERRVVPGGITKERDTAVLNKRMQEGYTGSGAVGLKQSVMNQTQARASADPRWHKRGTVRKPYDNTQSAEWNALNQQRTEDLEGWEQVRAAFGYRDSAYGASSEQAVMAQLINNWARTSSDRDWRGVVMQMAVKEEFDTPVRVFAADYWNNAVESDKIVKLAEEKIAEFPEMMGALRAFVRAQYEQTQAFLKEMDISEVTLYRGMRIPQSAVEAAPEDGGVPWGAGLSTVTLSDNPIASWSIRHSVSRGVFSSGTMLRASCPREMVFSCPLTGFGCASEYEVLILNAGDNSAWMAQHGTVHIDDERLARISDDIIKLQEQELKYMEEETNLTALNGGAGPEYGTYERSRLYEVRNERRQAEQQRANLQRLQENRVEQWQYRKETDLKNYIHQALQENPELAGKTVKIPKKKMPTDMTLAERKVADLKKKISGQKRKISNRKKKAEEARFKAAISRAKLGETGVGGYIRSGETYGGMTWEGKQFHFSTWNIDSLERDANWYDEQAAKMESELENMNESLAAAEEEVKREVVTKSVYQVRLARLMERV